MDEGQLLAKAIQELSHTDDRPSDRDLVVAYAILAAFTDHWPSSTEPQHFKLLADFQWVREADPSRFLKQRRLALAMLSRSARVV